MQVRGSALALVVGGVGLLGALVASFWASAREQDLAAHNVHAGEACRHLARAAARVTILAVRRALVVDVSKVRSAGGTALMEVLLQPDQQLGQSLAELHQSAGDQRSALEELLGSEFLGPVDRGLLPCYPGARVRVALEVRPEGLYDDFYRGADGHAPAFLDPFERRLVLTVRAEARWGAVTRTEVLVKEARVNSLLPPQASRFALYLGQATSEALDRRTAEHVVLAHGRQGGDRSEIARGEDTRGDLTAPELVKKFEDRGFVYLGGEREAEAATELTTVLLPAGASDHLFMDPMQAEPHALRAVRAPEQPGGLGALRPRDPDTGATQAPFAQALFMGFCPQMAEVDLFGLSLPKQLSTCSWQFFGTRDRPTRTLLVGPVAARAARLADVAVDRDASRDDEDRQALEAGGPTPVRETVVPFLKAVDEPSWREDLATEATAPLSLAHLEPFCAPDLMEAAAGNDSGRYGLLTNLNTCVDRDGDGVPETPVPSEQGHDPVRVELAEYQYGRLFADYRQYCGYSSTAAERFSFNLLARTMGLAPDLALAELWAERAQEPTAVVFDGPQARRPRGLVTARDLELPWKDARHGRSRAPMFDGRRGGEDEPGRVPVDAMLLRRATVSMTEAELRRRFTTDGRRGRTGTIDLRGQTLRVDQLRLGFEHTPTGWKCSSEQFVVARRHPFRNPMRPGGLQALDGGGSLVCGSLEARETNILPSRDGAPLALFAPLTTLSQPFDLAVYLGAGDLGLPTALPAPRRVAGGLYMANAPGTRAGGPLVVEYDRLWDPTAEDVARHYRGFVADAAMFTDTFATRLERAAGAP